MRFKVRGVLLPHSPLNMNNCIVCGSPTANPKFCSRSCAAKHNNVSSPKRRPEGKCSKCGTSILTKDRYCKTCLEEVRSQQTREAANIRRWSTVSGDWEEHSIEKVAVQKRAIFQIDSTLPSISKNDRSGRLLDRLIGLCFSAPEYLCHEDAARYITLLNELKRFNCTSWRRAQPLQMKVEDLPIDELGRAIADWVQAYFGDNRCALLPAYALDTAVFIERHVSGHYQANPEWWEIEPMLVLAIVIFSASSTRDLRATLLRDLRAHLFAAECRKVVQLDSKRELWCQAARNSAP